MKHLRIFTFILAALSFTVVDSSAQTSYSGYSYNGGMSENMSRGLGAPGGGSVATSAAKELDMLAMVGLFEIDSKRAVSKMKISDSELQRSIHKAVATYIIAYGDVMSINSGDIDVINSVQDMVKQATNSGQSIDPTSSSMRDVMMEMRKSMMTLNMAMRPIHQELNDTMAELLKEDKKALKKWTSYYKSVCTDNNFVPNGESSNTQSQRQSGGQGGPGGGQGGQGGGQGGPGGR